MKLETITGVKDFKVRVHKPISGILIVKDGNVDAETVAITRVDGQRGAVEHVCPKMELSEHFEISAHGEGLYIDKNTGSRGLVAIGMNGAASLANDRYLDIELGGLTEAAEYIVYGMEEGEITGRLITYHPIIINRDVESRDFGIGEHEWVALPFTDLEKVELIGLGGESVTYLPEELKAKMETENDICALHDDGDAETIYYGYRDMALLKVEGIRTIKIHKTGGNSYQVIFIDQK